MFCFLRELDRPLRRFADYSAKWLYADRAKFLWLAFLRTWNARMANTAILGDSLDRLR